MNRVSAACALPYHIPRDALAVGANVPAVWTGRAASAVRPPRPRRAPEAVSRTSGGLRRLLPPVLFACVLAGSMLGLAARERIVRAAPALGVVYAAIGLPTNPLGLAIEDVHARIGEFGSKKVLLVDGAITNLRPRDVAAPALRIVLRGEDGRELYQWTTRAPKTSLARAERVPFKARLEAPPDDVKDAVVSFVDTAESPVRRRGGS
jgi:hypothetical protein